MTAKDLKDIGQWVAAAHGWPVAKAFKAWTADDAARAHLSGRALDLLRVMPVEVERDALTCAYAVHLLRGWDAPAQVVGGTLRIEGEAVGGERLWIMIGSLIVDVALFREAYAAQGPGVLARFVHLHFGPGKALYAEEWKQARRRGLSYEPARILDADEVTARMAPAHRALAER